MERSGNIQVCLRKEVKSGGEKVSLFNFRTSLLFVLSFMGFLRFSEVIKLEISDFKKMHRPIFTGKRKTFIKAFNFAH